MKATIWHNSRCGTSRKALAALHEAGLTPEIIDYHRTGWTEEGLRSLFASAGLTAHEALRHKEPLARELGLNRPEATEDEIIQAMITHPILVERPFVRTDKGTRLCRPLERLNDLLR